MKELFTADEWDSLTLLPFYVFVLVAGADGKIDQKEIAQLGADFEKTMLYKDPLHRELFSDIMGSDMEALIKRAMNPNLVQERLQKAKSCLQAKLDHEAYQHFIGSIFIFGLNIANASGGGWLGMGSKISEEEKVVLAGLGVLFELDVASLHASFS